MDFLNTLLNLPISIFDLFLIVIGVLALLFGLIGKAPKRIFHMIWVIAAIPVAYFVFTSYGNVAIDAINSTGVLDSLTSDATVSAIIKPEMVTGLVNSVVFYVLGIACLIVVPLVGDIIVSLFTIKAKKRTAKKTLGIPNLISIAVAWTFIFLPIILLTPLVTQAESLIPTISSLMGGNNDSTSGSGDSSKSHESFDGEHGVIVTLGTKQVVSSNPLEGIFNEDKTGIGDMVVAQFTKSKYLQFTSTTGKAFVEDTVSKLTNTNFKFLSYGKVDAEGQPVLDENGKQVTVSILDAIVQTASLASDPAIQNVIGAMTNGGSPEELLADPEALTDIVLLLGNPDYADSKELITGVLVGAMGDDPMGAAIAGVINNINEENAQSIANVMSVALPAVMGDGDPTQAIVEGIFSKDADEVKGLINDIGSCAELLTDLPIFGEGDDSEAGEMINAIVNMEESDKEAISQLAGAINFSSDSAPTFEMPEKEEDQTKLITAIASAANDEESIVGGLASMLGDGALFDMAKGDNEEVENVEDLEIIKTAESLVGEGEGKISEAEFNALKDLFKKAEPKIEEPFESPKEGEGALPKGEVPSGDDTLPPSTQDK